MIKQILYDILQCTVFKMAWNPNASIECRKRLAWTIACERAVVTKEDAVQIYNKVMKEFETIDKRQQYKERESNKTQVT